MQFDNLVRYLDEVYNYEILTNENICSGVTRVDYNDECLWYRNITIVYLPNFCSVSVNGHSYFIRKKQHRITFFMEIAIAFERSLQKCE